jgi:Uncharacterized protein conserved in bacteria
VTRYFCFLRAINVGGHTVTMPTLKKLFEAMDFRNVETFIASGNVVFETSRRDPRKIEETISKNLHKALGYEVHSFVRTRDELAAVESFQPFSAAKIENAMTYYIGFGTGPYGSVHKKNVAGLQTATTIFSPTDTRSIGCVRRARASRKSRVPQSKKPSVAARRSATSTQFDDF